jgi:hypothetical protein
MSNLKKIKFGEAGPQVEFPTFKPFTLDTSKEGLSKRLENAREFFGNPNMMFRAATDSAFLGIPFKMFDYFKQTENEEEGYIPAVDPQLQPYYDVYPDLFFDSRSAIESTERLNNLLQKLDDVKNPFYNATRVVSEIFTDPSSVLLLSKPLRLALMAKNQNRFSTIAKIMAAEETSKQIFDRDRTATDAAVIGTLAVALHKLSPTLMKYDKRYNKYRYDPSNDRGVIIDLDDLADVTKTEAGTTATRLLVGPQPLPTYKLTPKPGVPKNVKDLLKIFKNEYPTMKIIVGAKVGKLSAGGKYVPAYYNKFKDEMVLDIEGIKKMYRDGRPFKDIKMADGTVIGFKKGAFKNEDEFVDFVMRHEFAHKTYRRRKGETKAAYENRINKIAYQGVLDNRKDIQKIGSTMLDDYKVKDQEAYNYGMFEKELFENMKWQDISYKQSTLRSSMVTGLTKATQVLSPLDYFIHSGSKTGKLFAINMFNSPLMYSFNKGLPSPDTVEQMRNLQFGPTMFDVLEEGYQVAKRITRKMQGKDRAFFMNWKGFSSLKFKNVMTPDEVFKAVTYARMNKNKHELPDIAEYAAYIDKFFIPMRDRANELGMPFISNIKREEFVNVLDTHFANTRNKVYKNTVTGETWTRAEAAAYKKNVELDIKLTKAFDDPHYVPINWLYDQISTRWNEFSSLLAKQMSLARDKKTGARKYTDEDIETIIPNFMNYAENAAPITPKGVPPGMLYQMKRGFFSKHLKTRFLKDIDYVPLMRAGFIDDNMQSIIAHYFRSVAPDIAMTEKFGDPFGFGWFYGQKKGLAPGIIQISEDLLKEGPKGYGLSRAEFNKRYEIEITKAENIVSLIKNKYGLPDNPQGYMYKTSAIIKISSNLLHLTGITQIADIGRVIAVDGLMNTIPKLLEAFSGGMGKALFERGLKESNLAFQAIDLGLHFGRQDIISGNDQLRSSFTGVEKIFQKLNQIAFQYGNLQNPWTTAIKVPATLLVNTKLIDIIERIGKGTAKQWEIEYLNNLGIGSKTATHKKILKEILDNYYKHGHGVGTVNGPFAKEYNLLKLPNTDLWTNSTATMKFRAASNKEVDNIIVTPGLSDAPLIANTMFGSVLFQYKKFGLGYTRRVLYRGMMVDDGNFLMNIAALVAMGMMIDAFRSQQTNAPYQSMTLREKVLSGAERGGVGGYFTDIDRLVMALTNNNVGIRPTLLGINKPYGTTLKRKMGSIAPVGSTIGNIYEILYDWGRGRHNHHTARRIRRLIPFNNLWYADFLFDKLEKGLY